MGKSHIFSHGKSRFITVNSWILVITISLNNMASFANKGGRKLIQKSSNYMKPQ